MKLKQTTTLLSVSLLSSKLWIRWANYSTCFGVASSGGFGEEVQGLEVDSNEEDSNTKRQMSS